MSGELCGVDSGYTTLATSTAATAGTAGTATDGTVAHHRVYVSVTRDGSVWLRLGRDQAASQEVWTYVDERRAHFHTTLLTDSDIQLLQVFAWTCSHSEADSCGIIHVPLGEFSSK